jgi:heme-degrading monooxygenase HmoA
MIMNIVTEIVHMNTKESIPKDGFIQIVDALERGFHSKQSGFLDTELLYDEKADTWIMIQHWESLEQMKAASANMFKDSATEAFRDAIEPKTVSISVFPVLGSWTGTETGK